MEADYTTLLDFAGADGLLLLYPRQSNTTL